MYSTALRARGTAVIGFDVPFNREVLDGNGWFFSDAADVAEHVVSAEADPASTEARATAQNVLFNIGRGVGGFGPVVVGALALSYSFQTAIALLALIYVIDMVATIFLIPELKGKELT